MYRFDFYTPNSNINYSYKLYDTTKRFLQQLKYLLSLININGIKAPYVFVVTNTSGIKATPAGL